LAAATVPAMCGYEHRHRWAFARRRLGGGGSTRTAPPQSNVRRVLAERQRPCRASVWEAPPNVGRPITHRSWPMLVPKNQGDRRGASSLGGVAGDHR
jgi:hypothetical protein